MTLTAVPRLRSPIVLVHGFLGFDQIKVGPWTVANYFPRIPAVLGQCGNRVLIPRLSPTRGVAERAAQLKAFLEREAPGEPVHLFAHSMGGLDSRYMISRLGMADRVLSLTTLGTPHRGTTFADWGINRLERIVKPFLLMLGIPTGAFYDLTTAAARTFNDAVPDVPGVRYFSVAGEFRGRFSPEWALSQSVVSKHEGPNDGIVSQASARYGESLDVWEGDHLSLVNWVNPLARTCGLWRDRTPHYAPLLRRLADEGF
jgi:triacylglycerol lipase